MHTLSPRGQAAISALANQYQLSTSAVMALWFALDYGNGTMAQFNHPELGGMGQWTQGGMLMIGDMFNHNLKAVVANLAHDLVLLRQQDGIRVESAPLPFVQVVNWWGNLGYPASVGSQNSTDYAVFPDRRRLALRINGTVTVYDTGDHVISGVGQQQFNGMSCFTFNSQYGTVNVEQLPQLTQELE